MQYWGHHLLLNARNCLPNTIRSKQRIECFSKDLVSRINMIPYGTPTIVMFGSGNKKGYTLVQLIETSNITGHFVEETNDMYLDVFSCKDFEDDKVKEVVQSYFSPTNIDTKFVYRDASIYME